MKLDEAALDEARYAWRSGGREQLQRVQLTAMTLGACLEAACWATEGSDDVQAFLESWCGPVSALPKALRGLTTVTELSRPGDHDAPRSELRRCPTRGELVDAGVGVEWRYFLDRFRRSLVTHMGLPASAAGRLAAALAEMVDNVVEHAGLGDAPVGVVAYEVLDDRLSFAVADLGRGVLASLSENEENASVTSDADALRAAVISAASRRPGVDGRGFQDLLRALADMEGTLSFRSGSARLQLDGRGRGNRVASTSNSPSMRGFQMAVSAQPTKSAW